LIFRFYAFQEVMYQGCCFFHYVSFASCTKCSYILTQYDQQNNGEDQN
jgi:hypothetical protein